MNVRMIWQLAAGNKSKNHLTRTHQVVFSEITPAPSRAPGLSDQWNCSSSVEPVRAFTEDEPPWITVVTSSK